MKGPRAGQSQKVAFSKTGTHNHGEVEQMGGLLIASPMSGSGKTTVTLGLLRAMKRRGEVMAPGKAGPDYIDPAFHTAACGVSCINYDPWAMRDDLLILQAETARSEGKILLIEAMMGLFDAAADGTGSAADLAALLGIPVILVLDCGRLSHSVAALAKGYVDYRPDVVIAGVILNNVASERHEVMLRDALSAAGVDIFGVIRRNPSLAVPERHLGLVQAAEHSELETFLENAAGTMERECDLSGIVELADSTEQPSSAVDCAPLPPFGQRIAVARDEAFGFSYEHMFAGWRRMGAELTFFSPLEDEVPAEDCDAVYLPGGYPELHAGRLAAGDTFRRAMHRHAVSGKAVYGECGGYMVLGDGLVDEHGISHRMLGLLPLTTSYEERRLHLGYRRIIPNDGFFWNRPMRGHEFHYSTTISECGDNRLFKVSDATGKSLGLTGLQRGNVAGSFIHLIDLDVDHG